MTNLELIQKAEKERLAMIVAANKAGDKVAYEKAKPRVELPVLRTLRFTIGGIIGLLGVLCMV